MHQTRLLPLLDPDAARRRAAVDELSGELDDSPKTLEGNSACACALRQVLLADPDATVRAHAAEGVGRLLAARRTRFEQGGDPWAGWLEDAAEDGHASVREIAYRGLGRARARAAVPMLERASVREPVWSARRSAVLALAAAAGAGATDALLAALDDPFWRVRHAAIHALAVLASSDAGVRDRVLSAPAAAVTPMTSDVAAWAIEYLRRGMAGAALPPLDPEPRPEPARRSDAGVDPVWDPDPAVMTARFEDERVEVSAASLLEAVADAHEPLRKAAARRLCACADMRTYRAALLWLDEPRIPHAAQCVCSVLDQLGDMAADLAAEVLEPGGDAGDGIHGSHGPHGSHGSHGPGARVWALSWAARTRSHAFAGAVMAHAKAKDSKVRATALEALACLAVSFHGADGAGGVSTDDAVRALDLGTRDPVAEVRLAAARGLFEIRTPGAYAALAAMRYAEQPVAIRRALVSAAVAQGDLERLRAVATAEPHAELAELVVDDPWCRAQALAALDERGALDPATRAQAAADPDPWLRAAVLDETGALAALAMGPDAGDPDPLVRRAAIEWIIAGSERADVRARVGLECATDPDPWIRSRAAALLDPARHGDELVALLALSGDTVPMVRAAAADPLSACARIDERLAALLAQRDAGTSDRARISAYTWLARRFDDQAGALVARALDQGSEPPAVLEHLDALALALPLPAPRPARVAAKKPARAPSRPAASAAITAPGIMSARRVLGRTGIEVSPLAISGVYELPGGALLQAHRAGVNLFFWEPRYRAMTRFLRSSPARRRDLVIAAGTFHASRASIEADVDRALRRLRTDHLDIFLIFWVRSAARLSDEVRACLHDLFAKGKIRAAGFSTHDRELAARAVREQDWDVVMVRHSAAHHGAERALFPVAREREVGVLTFSALCYGRMLRAVPGSTIAPSAADCYRYSLSQPGVTACISAPRRHAELVHNLAVLDAPVLDPAAADALRVHGQRVHDRNKDFNALIRREPERMVQGALGPHAGLSGRGAPDDIADTADAALDTVLDELLDDVAPPAHF